eukprot:gnl/TRDRNA2_/TRDRNA2_173486_c19_seq2.p5 gnl/TRDRNA2_/TRDRNA2_173486_c19~~gnl/TRDRNA2_/TRDRNA2_173486_c19_seq2.p5  ORF type:complete len:136 (+),score=20.39 gnl/TRDRNA2_/TRDRNA2_173486_c19_seq2:525-932(+)
MALHHSVDEFSQQGLINMSWAFAIARHSAPVALKSLSSAVQRRMREFSTRELVDAAWAFSAAASSEPSLFSAMSRIAEHSIGNLTASGLAKAAWASATLGERVCTMQDLISSLSAGHTDGGVETPNEWIHYKMSI